MYDDLAKRFSRDLSLMQSPALPDDGRSLGGRPLFESLCVRDLRVYSSVFGGDVYHYRDKSNLEVDAILRLQDGRWAAIEVKLGGAERIEEGAGNLKTLAGKVDHDKMGRPAFLIALTGGEFAHTRDDGVHVVPLGCLMP